MIRPTFMFLGMLFLHASLVATGISPLAFKNVFQCFGPEYEYCSPIFGKVALDIGLIENLRFYNIIPAYKGERREFVKDKTPAADDHIMQIIKILFPSPGGQLTTIADTKNNFGKLSTKPEHIAELMNFAQIVRLYLTHQKSHNLLALSASNIKNIISVLNPNESEQNKKKSPFNPEKKIKAPFPTSEKFEKIEFGPLLLTSIVKAIIAEEKSSFYPKYFVEQIITAVFCHKFSDQKDIRSFLNALLDETVIFWDKKYNDVFIKISLVDKSKIAAVGGNISEDDFKASLQRIQNGEVMTQDDIWGIVNCDSFSRALPYKGGKPPISNGLAKKYKRETNEQSDDTFADCTEVTLRHICNFFLYDQESKMFELKHLNAHMDGKLNPFIKNFKDFYELQTPSKADAGSSDLRSAWNKVVADLGKESGVAYWQKFADADEKNSNELAPGMFNMMRVFKTLFDLDFEPEPKLEAGKDKIEIWIEAAIKKLCAVLNPKKECSIDIENLEVNVQVQDVFGKIIIEVQDEEEEEDLFKFTIHVNPGHAEISELTLEPSPHAIIIEEDIQQKIVSRIIFEEKGKTIAPSLLLPNREIIPEEKIKELCPLYRLFGEPICDINSMMKALNIIVEEGEKYQLFAQNILNAYPWDDEESREQAMEVVLKIKKAGDWGKEATAYGVKGLYLKNDEESQLLNDFPNVQFLNFESPVSVIDPQIVLKKVVEIGCFGGGGDNLEVKEINFDKFPSLKDIWTAETLLTKVKPQAPLEKMKSLHLRSKKALEIDLDKFPNLEGLFLFAENIDGLQPQVPLNKLLELSLSSHKSISVNLEYFPNVRDVALQIQNNDGENKNDIKIYGSKSCFEKITSLLLGIAGLQEIDLNKFPNLEKLNLISMPELKVLKIKNPLNTLTWLRFDQVKMENIDLGMFPNLKEICLDYDAMTTITGIEKCQFLNKEELQHRYPNIIIKE